MSQGTMARFFAGVLLVCASAHAQSIPVTVVNTASRPVPTTIVNSPAVTVTGPVQVSGSVQVTGTPTVQLAGTPTVQLAGTPTVVVANQAGAGTPVYDIFTLTTDVCCGTVTPPGHIVPANMVRTVTTVSGEWSCPTGHMALIQLHSGSSSIYLPGQLALKRDGQDFFAGVVQLNLPQVSGTAFQLVVDNDGGVCQVIVYVAGLDTPAP